MEIKFVAEKEEELIKAIKREKSDEILKQWLETPVEVGRFKGAGLGDLMFIEWMGVANENPRKVSKSGR